MTFNLSASHPLFWGVALACGDAIVRQARLPRADLPRRGAYMILENSGSPAPSGSDNRPPIGTRAED